MTKIYLVRHGETAWNQAKRYQGQTDIPLTDRGRQQAKRVAERLAGAGASFLISGDLVGLWTLQHPLGRSSSCRWSAAPFTGAVHYGRWEGLTRAEIKLYPKEWQHQEEPLLAARRRRGLGRIERKKHQGTGLGDHRYRGQIGIVVSHGGLLRALLAWIASRVQPLYTPWTTAASA